jgi:hypothetical protein
MNRAGKQHPLETLVEWVAPLPLALAVAWAMRAVGYAPASLAVAAGAAFAAGVALIKKAGSGFAGAICEFEPATFEPDELLLEEKDAVLELTDPLVEVDPDSRVIRLFARQEPTPGELVDRITDFLGEGGRPAPGELPEPSASPVDASAALHAALANIRASLR